MRYSIQLCLDPLESDPTAMLPCYVLLDLETTGGNAQQDRVTEIAAVRMVHGQEVVRWSTLVNPGVRISHFIE